MNISKMYPLQFSISDIGIVGYGGHDWRGFWVFDIACDESWGFHYILLTNILSILGYKILDQSDYEADDFCFSEITTNMPSEVYQKIMDCVEEEDNG